MLVLTDAGTEHGDANVERCQVDAHGLGDADDGVLGHGVDAEPRYRDVSGPSTRC